MAKTTPEKERAREIVEECLREAADSAKLRRAIMTEIMSKARTMAVSKQRRRKIAQNAARARWSRRKVQKALET